MDRQILDSLYLGSRTGAFRKALAHFDEQSFFLRERAQELGADQLVELLGKPLSDDLGLRVEPFVRALADALIALVDQPAVDPGPLSANRVEQRGIEFWQIDIL